MYVPVRVNPEQPVTGAALGVLKVEQVAAPDLADRFARMAREKGVPCSRLAFELTESRSLRGTDGVPLLIRQLFAAGAAITVDDFGAGHSNLTRILDLPEAGAVKLDRYVMRTCLTRDPKLLAHLIDFVHDCGKLVIAQGVESRQQAQQLVKLGGGLYAGLLLRHAHGCRRAAPVSASGSALSVHLPLFCPAFCVAKRGKIL